ncbi:augmin complex subunit dgt3-like isoform X2 [Teleopsis dalmanni]|uniref:augmin complex subunit dgt3-like isoform X2 n=1 Tax=Teleopsis dalmanni TaxID=139649 RepID=UPI0018CED821|nr:augmin complex subunit dgt3-like isoform X2 [Teleopsis dalmanni]
MCDLVNNSDILKKLGFDHSNQWILYDDRFKKEIIEKDLIEYELQNASERQERIKQLEHEYPGLCASDSEMESLVNEVMELEHADKSYAILIEEMRINKDQINTNLSKIEESLNKLKNSEKEMLAVCQNKTKQLEELQRANVNLVNETKKYFTQIQSPPLFVHQLPLEQYFLKCDSFMQYFNLYMKENFKIQEYIEFDIDDEDCELAKKLQELENSIAHYTLAYIKEKAKAKATQTLIDHLDISQVHIISLDHMERVTREFEQLNTHNLKNETLLNDLAMHVQQHSRQQIELILYENTKNKLERASKRLEDNKQLGKIISDTILNAELIWIAIQLDMEKKRNRFDNTEKLNTDAMLCSERIKCMRNSQLTLTSNAANLNILVKKGVDLLSKHLGQRMRYEQKPFLYEYEKFCRLFVYELNALTNIKSSKALMDLINKLKSLENNLKPLVYDGPVARPTFEQVHFLIPLFDARSSQQQISDTLRDIRGKFYTNITERMKKDTLWHNSQMLWIWFLRNPTRVIAAIDEVKKATNKERSIPGVNIRGMNHLTGIKTLAGLKRK